MKVMWLFNWHKELHGVNIYPHKTWDTLTEESRGYYREDADQIVNAHWEAEGFKTLENFLAGQFQPSDKVEEVKKILERRYGDDICYEEYAEEVAEEICQLFKDKEEK